MGVKIGTKLLTSKRLLLR
ncbi:hypothetical protein Gotur_024304, partial [Gossypium turneri]